MIWLGAWIQHPAASAISRTLLHSLWQAAIVALVLAAALKAARSSSVRYAAACLGLAVIVTAFVATLIYEIGQPRAEVRFRADALVHIDAFGASSPEQSSPNAGGFDVDALSPFLAPFWMAGLVVFNLRHFASGLAGRRLRRKGVCLASDHWQERLDSFRIRLGVRRRVALLESCFVSGPVVMGHLRTVILLPVGLLTGLPAEQVGLILIHELAHIRRHDYIVNVIQSLAESLLFYHPLVWWISRVIRTEREHCCDDAVVTVTKEPHAYAVVLAALEEKRSRAAEAAIAATGGSLVKRIHRLLSQPAATVPLLPLLCFGLILGVTAAVIARPGVSLQPPALMPAAIETPVAQDQTRAASPARATLPGASPGAEARALAIWIQEDVSYIIAAEERQAFSELQSDQEREQFIQQFWLRRDPTPGTPQNEFKEEHYSRIAYANQRFTVPSMPGWKTDRGRVLVMYGKPDELESHASGGTYDRPTEVGGGTTRTFPFEIWRYRYIEGIGNEVLLEFVDTTRSGDFRAVVHTGGKRGRVAAAQTAKTAFVLGGVNRPGEFILAGNSITLAQALGAAGGLSPNAGDVIDVIRWREGRVETTTINRDAFLNGRMPEVFVFPNDIVFVRRIGQPR